MSFIDTLAGTQAHNLKICPGYPLRMEEYSCFFFFFSVVPSKKLQPAGLFSPGNLSEANPNHCLTHWDLLHLLGVFNYCMFIITIYKLNLSPLSEFKAPEGLFQNLLWACYDVCWWSECPFQSELICFKKFDSVVWTPVFSPQNFSFCCELSLWLVK